MPESHKDIPAGAVTSGPGGFVVPGGVVTVQPRGLGTRLRSIHWRGYDTHEVMGDVVIYDEARARELYREGPYDRISAPRSLKRVLAEIEREGLDYFLRRRQVERVPRTHLRTFVSALLHRSR